MNDFDPKMAKSLLDAIQALRTAAPEITDILDKAKSGELDETAAMSSLMEAVAANPDVAEKFQGIMKGALTPTRESPPMPPTMFAARGGLGVPTLNPLLQGALVERAQFDGDMPELRTGGLLPGIKPAVPIKTTARDSVALGAMLAKASEKVGKVLTAKVEERRKALDATLKTMKKHGSALARLDNDGGALVEGDKSDDPIGYRRGEVPKPITVRTPSGRSLASLTEAQKHEMAWRFLATTQGRRSAVDIIRNTIAAILQRDGILVEERDFDPYQPPQTPLAFAEWSVTLAGPGATQPAFALIDVASKTLAHRLRTGLGATKPERCWLEVEAVNRIADREVGWMARMVPDVQ